MWCIDVLTKANKPVIYISVGMALLLSWHGLKSTRSEYMMMISLSLAFDCTKRGNPPPPKQRILFFEHLHSLRLPIGWGACWSLDQGSPYTHTDTHTDVWEAGSVPPHYTHTHTEGGAAWLQHVNGLITKQYRLPFSCTLLGCLVPRSWDAMSAYRSLWSCTSTELVVPASSNTTLDLRVGATPHCDLTLLTCLLIGSYRFCIVPLLAAFHAKPKTQQWGSKWGLSMALELFVFVSRLESPTVSVRFEITSALCVVCWNWNPCLILETAQQSNIAFSAACCVIVLVTWQQHERRLGRKAMFVPMERGFQF